MIDEIDRGLENAHPVARALALKIRGFERLRANTKVEQSVLKYGRPFIGIERPKDCRQRAKKRAFANAGNLADGQHIFYVEGFVTVEAGPPVHSAWITFDGVHAIDVTFKDAPKRFYFGIPFSLAAVNRCHDRKACWPLIDPYAADHGIEGLLEYAVSHPPIYRTGIELAARGQNEIELPDNVVRLRPPQRR